MSAALSPILGFLIDKIGKRALMITISSVLVSFSCFFSACLPVYSEPNFICLVPLILIGFGYSIYASALWSSIPYLVIPRTIGSAFGLVTSLQACGLVFSPFIVGLLQTKFPNSFAPVYIFLGTLATIGCFFNIWLYTDDIKNRGSVLNNVPVMLEEMMVSPKVERKSLLPDAALLGEMEPLELGIPENVVIYEFDKDATKETRAALKRSLVRSSIVRP
jgi:MFS family permease